MTVDVMTMVCNVIPIEWFISIYSENVENFFFLFIVHCLWMFFLVSLITVPFSINIFSLFLVYHKNFCIFLFLPSCIFFLQIYFFIKNYCSLLANNNTNKNRRKIIKTFKKFIGTTKGMSSSLLDTFQTDWITGRSCMAAVVGKI